MSANALSLLKDLLLPLLGALVGAGLKGWFENRRLFRLVEARHVYGRWSGDIKYLQTRDPADRISLELRRKSPWEPSYWLNPKLVTGAAQSGNGTFVLQGGFYQPDELMLDYRSDNPNDRHFGSIVLKLDTSGTRLEGYFVGHSDGLFAAEMNLEKVVSSPNERSKIRG
jgi:hypothetical protein